MNWTKMDITTAKPMLLEFFKIYFKKPKTAKEVVEQHVNGCNFYKRPTTKPVKKDWRFLNNVKVFVAGKPKVFKFANFKNNFDGLVSLGENSIIGKVFSAFLNGTSSSPIIFVANSQESFLVTGKHELIMASYLGFLPNVIIIHE